MASSDRGKPLLYVDLFKPRKTMAAIEGGKPHDGFEGQISSPSSFSHDSYCSGFTTPFGSELSSSGAGSEEGDEAFMAELTRQMAECMLDEEEEGRTEEESVESCVFEDFEASGEFKKYDMNQNSGDPSSINIFKNRKFLPNYPSYAAELLPQIQVYQLKNQPPVAPNKKKQAQKRVDGHYYMQHRSVKGNNMGSGMKAVFLGENGSSGTGVFLPRFPDDPAQVKKKPGCSTVLIPTRVLQALELHFNKISNSDSTSPPTLARVPGTLVSDSRDGLSRRQKGGSDLEKWPEATAEEMHLPQEWTY